MRDYWLYFLIESKDMEVIPRFAKGNNAVEAYFNASQMASFSKEELDRYTKDMMNEWDYANSIAFAKKEGVQKALLKDMQRALRKAKRKAVLKAKLRLRVL